MSLYLKYRPKTFKDIVGQEFVKKTLPKAIQKGKIVGSYLFTGPKGTGKTSVARIFANSLMCENFGEDLCLTCDNCKESIEGNNIDIIEMDAASNSSVENIKRIIETAHFQPGRNHKYKIYIIDEVHMLSKSAFNALLKIMEEPPEYMVFILATTELDKIPETILSRCQNYNFSNINNEDIYNRLEFICGKENIKYDKEGLDIIIKISEGSLRNAIKYLEQHSSFSDSVIGKDVSDIIGTTGNDVIQELLKNLYLKKSENYNNVINTYNGLIQSGKNINLFIKDVCYFLRDKLVEEYGKSTPNIENVKIYSFMLEEFDTCLIKMKNSVNGDLTLLATLGNILSQK